MRDLARTVGGAFVPRTLLAMAAVLAGLLLGPAAQAGVAMDNTVVLDPFDPVPPIQFQHWYGGYRHGYGRDCDGCRERVVDNCEDRCDPGYRRDGCDRGCGRRDGCDQGCGRRDGCDRGCGRHDGCDHGCGRNRCDDGCQTSYGSAPCTQNCYDAERWEHRWRNGDQVGQEWYDSGSRERSGTGGHGANQWYGKEDENEWRDSADEDDTGPPPPPPSDDTNRNRDHDHDHDHEH